MQYYGGIQRSLFDFQDNNNNNGGKSDAVSSIGVLPPCDPFVKWAGGKGKHLTQLYAAAPSKFDRYFEPFLGGGALFFHLVSSVKHKRLITTAVTAYISDINSDLINTYIAIRDNVEKLIELLKIHKIEYTKDPKDYYYKLRDNYNNSRLITTDGTTIVERAAQLIVLNKTDYNGLYRVNRSGEFNAPIGENDKGEYNPLIWDSDNLRNVSLALNRSKVTIRASDYKKILLEDTTALGEGDFIYLDPPYHPLNSTADFTSYTNNRFSIKDQRELAEIFRKLGEDRKCKVMLTNSNTPLIRELYADFAKNTTAVSSKRSINCKGDKREGYTDLIIRNYSQ